MKNLRSVLTNALALALVLVLGVGVLTYADQTGVSGVRKVGLFGQQGSSNTYDALGAYAFDDSTGPGGLRRAIGAYSMNYIFSEAANKYQRVRGSLGAGMSVSPPIVAATEAGTGGGGFIGSGNVANPSAGDVILHIFNPGPKYVYLHRFILDCGDSCGVVFKTTSALGGTCAAASRVNLLAGIIGGGPTMEKECATMTIFETSDGGPSLFGTTNSAQEYDLRGFVLRAGKGLAFVATAGFTGNQSVTAFMHSEDSI